MCTINHDKKAIFINIPKTGRTYISENLVKYYGFTEYLDGDYEDEYTLEQIENETFDINKINSKKSFFNKDIGIINYFKNSKYLNKKINLNDDKWKDYFKFCFVRNPYERVVSGYEYVISKAMQKAEFFKSKRSSLQITPLTFEQFLNQNKTSFNDFNYIHVFRNQTFQIIDENNNIFVDYIAKYENIEDEFRYILKKIGFTNDEIEHETEPLNVTKHEHFKYYYENNNILNIINNLYNEDFDNFNYIKYDNYTDMLNL